MEKLEAYKASHGTQSRGTVLNQMHGDANFLDRHCEQVKLVLKCVMLCAKTETERKQRNGGGAQQGELFFLYQVTDVICLWFKKVQYKNLIFEKVVVMVNNFISKLVLHNLKH